MKSATAAAEPLDEPPGECAGLCGLAVGPGWRVANSVVTGLPRRIAPAARGGGAAFDAFGMRESLLGGGGRYLATAARRAHARILGGGSFACAARYPARYVSREALQARRDGG